MTKFEAVQQTIKEASREDVETFCLFQIMYAANVDIAAESLEEFAAKANVVTEAIFERAVAIYEENGGS